MKRPPYLVPEVFEDQNRLFIAQPASSKPAGTVLQIVPGTLVTKTFLFTDSSVRGDVQFSLFTFSSFIFAPTIFFISKGALSELLILE